MAQQTTNQVSFSINVKQSLTAMPTFYSSGEEVRKGDRVLVHGEAGEIEFIADPAMMGL